MNGEYGIHEEAALGKVYDAALMRRLLGYLRPYRGLAAISVGLIILSALLQLVGPLANAVALDLYIRPMSERSTQAAISSAVGEWLEGAGVTLSPVGGVAAMAAVHALSLLLAMVILYAQGYLMQLMGQLIMYDLRRDVFARLQSLPVSYFDSLPVGRLVTRATTDVAALNELFTSGLVAIFGDVVLLAGIITVLFALNWQLALVSFAVLPLLFALTMWFKTRARRAYREVRVRIARINAFLQEHLTGMGVVQLFNREEAAAAEFSEVNADHRDAAIRTIFYYAVFFPSVELITTLGVALIVWYGGGQVIQGALSLGALVAYLQYLERFYRPLADLSEKYNILQGAMASSERIFELIDWEDTIVSPPDAYRPTTVAGAIELDSVGFAYKEGEPVLSDLSLRIAPGETIAVVGHTGAGKSTLANLLLRFYDAGSGSVRIDGVDVRQWHLPSLRRAIAMVLQDVFLFAGDVGTNIRLGEEAIDDEKLRWAAAEVHAGEFIERLPEGFQTPVHERGSGLSVGQKQLIAFARALAFDPRILILDEATASIDTETEQLIELALMRLLAGRTNLVIAHRLSTIRRADRIVVLHKGRLCEQGTHQELLRARGIYHKLYLLQYREEDEAARHPSQLPDALAAGAALAGGSPRPPAPETPVPQM